MFDIIDSYTECLMPDEKAAFDLVWIGEKHCHFWPEMAIYEIVGAIMQNVVEAFEIHATQEVRAFRIGFYPRNHGFGRHHEFQ